MAFRLVWSKRARDEFDALQAAALDSIRRRASHPKAKASKQEGLFKQLTKCVQFLSENPRHPSLSTHKYDSIDHPYDKKQDVFEAYVQNKTPGAYRLFWCYGPKKGEITVIAITPHP